jgi:hypothetical protein|tara:strand:- start:585 stop:848 length:264 start_codon:yes stop_codon:yes gene_type:complete
MRGVRGFDRRVMSTVVGLSAGAESADEVYAVLDTAIGLNQVANAKKTNNGGVYGAGETCFLMAYRARVLTENISDRSRCLTEAAYLV